MRSALFFVHPGCRQTRFNFQSGARLGRGWKEGRLEAQGEQLLQNLINREQSLAARVEEARREALSLTEKARAEAEQLVTKARNSAEAKALEIRREAEAQAEAARAEIVAAAEAEAAGIAERAGQRRAEALKLVMERILS